jgi:hypothetical protein
MDISVRSTKDPDPPGSQQDFALLHSFCKEPIAFRLKLPDFAIEQSNKFQVGSKEGIITIFKPSSLKTPCSELT